MDPSYTYESVSILSSSLKKDPDENSLYIALLPDLRLFQTFGEKVTIICASEEDFCRTCASLSCTVIVLKSRSDIADVINLLTQYQDRIRSWKTALSCAVASGADLQTLLDISEACFTDPIIVMSKTLKVLAYTRNIPASHPDVAQTIQNGYFPRHMIKGLIENDYLQAAENFIEIGYHYPPNYIGCTKIIKVFKENSLQIHTICLYGLSQDPSPETMYRMKVLVEAIQQLLKETHSLHSLSEDRSACIFKELIKQVPASDELESKKTLLNWNENCTYRIYCVEFTRYFYPYVQFVVNCLQGEASYCNVFTIDQQIVILKKELQQSKASVQHRSSWLKALLAENDAYCGESDAFHDLASFRTAFRQAAATAHTGYLLNPDLIIYRYKDYYVYNLLQLCSKDIPLQQLYYKQLDAVRDYDRKHKTNDMILLQALLRHERNVTAVARELFLHRNTVIYRIKKLEEILGLSLDDPDVRLMLQLSIMMLTLAEKKEASMESKHGEDGSTDCSIKKTS